MARSTQIFRLDGPDITARKFVASDQGTYPAQGLTRKPMVAIYNVERKPLREVGGHVKHMLMNGNGHIDAKLVVTYLYEWSKTLETTSTVEWTSYGLHIVGANQRYSPASIVDTAPAPYTADAQGAELTAVQEMDTVALALLAGARLNTSLLEYAGILERRLIEVAQSYSSPNVNFQNLITARKGWSSNPDFKKMVAAIDMFLFREQNHEKSEFRIATLCARFHQCGGLTSFMTFLDKNFGDIGEMVGFLFDAKAVGNLSRLLEPTEEYDVEHSYFPYASFFKAYNKSPYSAANGPGLFFIIHVAGSLLLETRSLNAIVNQNGVSVSQMYNGCIIAYMLATTTQAKMLLGSGGITADVMRELNAATLELEPFVAPPREVGEPEEEYYARVENLKLRIPPRSRLATDWYKCYAANGFRLPTEIMVWITSQCNRIVEIGPRDNTVGAYVAQFFRTT